MSPHSQTRSEYADHFASIPAEGSSTSASIAIVTRRSGHDSRRHASGRIREARIRAPMPTTA